MLGRGDFMKIDAHKFQLKTNATDVVADTFAAAQSL
jgi:hypothetical protein